MIIGKTVVFIRVIDREGQREVKNLEHVGIVLDKFRGHEKIDGVYHAHDYYLVQLEGGVIGKFFCDEAKRIVIPNSSEPVYKLTHSRER